MATTGGYRIRPGGILDVPSAARLYVSCFGNDSLLDLILPDRRQHMGGFKTVMNRLFLDRYFDPIFKLTVTVDDNDSGRVVGFSWWKVPKRDLSIWERWLSPFCWFAPIARSLLSLYNKLFPVPNIPIGNFSMFTRVMDKVYPKILTTEPRRSAWYLSTLAVDPALQGQGLGGKLLDHGLVPVDDKKRVSYLVGLRGVEKFYGRFGFVEVARANVGELDMWDGGAVMFRE